MCAVSEALLLVGCNRPACCSTHYQALDGCRGTRWTSTGGFYNPLFSVACWFIPLTYPPTGTAPGVLEVVNDLQMERLHQGPLHALLTESGLQRRLIDG